MASNGFTNNHNNNANDSDPTVPGPYIAANSERWPLTAGTGHVWTKFCDLEGSLKMVMVFLFGTAGVVTLALLAHLRAVYNVGSGVGSAVVTDNTICTDTAVNILEQGGNAVDAAVGAVFCLSVVHFHVAGLGGGGVFLGYNERKREVFDVIDFQVTAPVALSNVSVGVPGVVAGLWEAHQRYGSLSWAELLSPAVHLARFGFPASQSLINASTCVQPSKNDGTLLHILASTGTGSNISIPYLADTLSLIADHGPTVFYNGSIADEIVYTIKVANGSMSRQDLANYKVTSLVSERTKFYDFDVIVPASSFSGTYLLNSLERIQVLDLQPQESLTGDMVRKMDDALYDTLETLLLKEGGMGPVGEGMHSTVVTISDSQHNLVSVVLGLNSLFGSKLMTDVGFLLNNFVHNDTVQSVGTPVIAIQTGHLCGRRILTGGGSVTSLVQVLTQLIPFSQASNASVESPRFHVGETPRSILLEDHHEPRLSDEALASLGTMKVSVGELTDAEGCLWYDAINTISLFGDEISPYADSRGDGAATSIQR